MEINLITAIFGAIGTFIGFLITVATFARNRDKDVRSSASEQAIINTKLDTISGGVESLRVDFKVEQKERAALSERVAKVEGSVSSAHKRLDRLEGD
ncbi:MAG: hypothetical protein RR595_12100 [Lysinibacillus sp.]